MLQRDHFRPDIGSRWLTQNNTKRKKKKRENRRFASGECKKRSREIFTPFNSLRCFAREISPAQSALIRWPQIDLTSSTFDTFSFLHLKAATYNQPCHTAIKFLPSHIVHIPVKVLLIEILEPSSLFQRMLGVGLPVALQVRLTLAPSRTIASDELCESSMFGGTATRNNIFGSSLWISNAVKYIWPITFYSHIQSY